MPPEPPPRERAEALRALHDEQHWPGCTCGWGATIALASAMCGLAEAHAASMHKALDERDKARDAANDLRYDRGMDEEYDALKARAEDAERQRDEARRAARLVAGVDSTLRVEDIIARAEAAEDRARRSEARWLEEREEREVAEASKADEERANAGLAEALREAQRERDDALVEARQMQERLTRVLAGAGAAERERDRYAAALREIAKPVAALPTHAYQHCPCGSCTARRALDGES